MADAQPADSSPSGGSSPVELRDPGTRREIRRAAIWLGMAVGIALVVLLIQQILVIFAGIVFATLLDGGVRLLGRVLPIGRGWRLLIVVLLVLAFLLGTFYLTGMQVTQQVLQLRSTLEAQALKVTGWLSSQGLMPGASDVSGLLRQAAGSIGRLTSWLGTAVGAITSLFMMMIIGLFLAIDPQGYGRGVQWLVPSDMRVEFGRTLEHMGRTLRKLLAGRLLGMAFEGVMTGIALGVGGVPMAMLLGIIAGILAFIPNIGAIITGVLMVAVGFSAGTHTGFWAIGTYLIVQTLDGYVVVPMVAKRTVDLPPALTLGTQIMASALFGILGLALADPFTAVVKAGLERAAERNDEDAGAPTEA
ncbi:putative PurR-regulated permease PerM [Sphingomonas sp. SORGH_AS802]|uniref:AI-2E family transporter n=1 Tax=unclassified Sphingomonas TaxID=196159 RepID=UPI002864F6A7|nr:MULTISPECIES: AI-2E family transporter [unclassified Sphingomonas]MDR6125760.1 putative PurR-regulated permease PerM [Sphingomonas sp. SORGH_AS_0438]MDR6134367.1 putative PurR-regulated permease PerM [Sphingomonas sp. SORGH_AS_0802]